jgi:hypothetical protein
MSRDTSVVRAMESVLQAGLTVRRLIPALGIERAVCRMVVERAFFPGGTVVAPARAPSNGRS